MLKKAFAVLALGIAALAAFAFFQRGNLPVSSVAASPDVSGKIAYARSGALWMYTGGSAQQLTAGPKDKQDKKDGQPSFSPDGSKIVYVRFDEGFSDLYRLSVSNPSNTVALTDHRPEAQTGVVGYNTEALWAMQPAWSPNGQRIAFTTDIGTEYPGLYSMDPNGDSVRKLEYLDHSQQTVEHPSWSPDGTKIAVASYLTGNGKGQIAVYDTTESKWIDLTNSKDGAYDPAWSPDGEWIAFTMREGTATNLYVVSTDATKWTGIYPTPIQLTTDGASRAPTWSPDGTKLAYVTLKDVSFDLYVAQVQLDTAGNPSLANAQQLTDKANIDASSGLSWAK